ncbi:hypothetical protein [Marinobacterium sp. BA1]|uniref:hypothetical protein n=1 Tax=Marinobacterium sp. BA1 TaxID=3138931 RepID=UPI0032E53F5A
MHIARHSLLMSLLLSAGLGLILGAVLGFPIAGITLGMIVWAVIQIRRFNVLREWLVGDTSEEPPELGRNSGRVGTHAKAHSGTRSFFAQRHLTLSAVFSGPARCSHHHRSQQ